MSEFVGVEGASVVLRSLPFKVGSSSFPMVEKGHGFGFINGLCVDNLLRDLYPQPSISSNARASITRSLVVDVNEIIKIVLILQSPARNTVT